MSARLSGLTKKTTKYLEILKGGYYDTCIYI